MYVSNIVYGEDGAAQLRDQIYLSIFSGNRMFGNYVYHKHKQSYHCVCVVGCCMSYVVMCDRSEALPHTCYSIPQV